MKKLSRQLNPYVYLIQKFLEKLSSHGQNPERCIKDDLPHIKSTFIDHPHKYPYISHCPNTPQIGETSAPVGVLKHRISTEQRSTDIPTSSAIYRQLQRPCNIYFLCKKVFSYLRHLSTKEYILKFLLSHMSMNCISIYAILHCCLCYYFLSLRYWCSSSGVHKSIIDGDGTFLRFESIYFLILAP